VNHIAFKLDTLDELTAKVAEIRANGYDEMLQIDHGWCTSVYLNDPNGIMVEFCVTTDADGFAQTEEEALRLLRQPVSEFGEESRKDADIATTV
jgi:catechol-2,3-dioxygenase